MILLMYDIYGERGAGLSAKQTEMQVFFQLQCKQ